MPKFYFRSEAADGHFRFGSIISDSLDEAKATLKRREFDCAAFQLSAEEKARLEEIAAAAIEAGEKVPPDVRAKLHVHSQEEPYELVYVGTDRDRAGQPGGVAHERAVPRGGVTA